MTVFDSLSIDHMVVFGVFKSELQRSGRGFVV